MYLRLRNLLHLNLLHLNPLWVALNLLHLQLRNRSQNRPSNLKCNGKLVLQFLASSFAGRPCINDSSCTNDSLTTIRRRLIDNDSSGIMSNESSATIRRRFVVNDS